MRAPSSPSGGESHLSHARQGMRVGSIVSLLAPHEWGHGMQHLARFGNLVVFGKDFAYDNDSELEYAMCGWLTETPRSYISSGQRSCP